MKILIIALSGIGDALMFTPALKLLKTSLPGSEIDVLVMFNGAEEIYRNNPNINKIIRFDFIKEGFYKSLGFIFSLKKKYDATINVYPSNRKEYNIIGFLIGAGKRAGVKYKRRNISNLGFLNNVTVEENDSVHNVQTNIKLCEALIKKCFSEEPPLELFLNSEDKSSATDFFIKHSIEEKHIVIGFHPGCATLKNHIKRRWEPEKFVKLAVRYIQNYKAKILLFGGPDEQDLKENIFNKINSENVFIVNADSINRGAAIMKRCNLFVTNDSSQMHIASALSLNVIAIIGPTNPAYIHPWKTTHEIVTLNLECSPCFFYSPRPLTCIRTDVKFKCIKELTVDMVYNASKKFI